MLARITEPTSRQDSLRVLAEVGVEAASYPTLNRRLPGYTAATWRPKLAAACAAHAALGPTSLVMFDVSTPGRRSFGMRRSRAGTHPTTPPWPSTGPTGAANTGPHNWHRLGNAPGGAATIACDLLC